MRILRCQKTTILDREIFILLLIKYKSRKKNQYICSNKKLIYLFRE